ncbi:hypothetical protein F0U62_01420 [Cystobacter fuscus]|uniref:NlpC/P60 family protein n=1 Tax=Cystobacter fuscus TaxID=43 RepID=UPI002B314337|nr:hypothetical protein F0U62_01420 [Cystobacter fuscus]
MTTAHEIRSLANRWLYTRYKYGGGDHNGIDCSHFVQEILKEAGHANAPYVQAKDISRSHLYSRISPAEVREGDIVHFSRGDDHMGIVSDAKAGIFIGAQTTNGVSPESYVQGYWSGMRPTFYRYVGD